MGKPKDITYEITEIVGTISKPKENSNWCKAIVRTLLNGEEPGIDIRRIDACTKTIGTGGIRLTDEEINNMVDLLLENGFGSYDSIRAALEKREDLFKSSKSET